VAEGHLVAFRHVYAVLGNLVHHQPEDLGPARGSFIGKQLILVHVEGQLVFIRYITVSQHMVDVAMGIEQLYGLQLVVTDKIREDLLLAAVVTARIDDDALPAFIVQHIGVLLELVKNKRLNPDHAAKMLFSLTTGKPATGISIQI
jgi:hypothetical protein